MNKIDRYIIKRLLSATLLVMLVLIFIFIIIDFSENSDSFTDRGASLSEIWSRYYLNYIPEMIRLVSPMAVFVAVLFVASQMTERLEWTALKSSGVSFFRYMTPYLVFAGFIAMGISYMDGFVVPKSNSERIQFEREYLRRTSDRLDRNRVYRQESPSTLLTLNFYDSRQHIGYQVRFFTFNDDNELVQELRADRMEWHEDIEKWKLFRSELKIFNENGFDLIKHETQDTTFNIIPRDLSRTSSDIYLLTYPEVVDYLDSIKRSGAAGIELPQIQFYGKLFYPIGILIVTLIGVILASERRKGGKGVIMGMGLVVIFFYLVTMKLIEPFGAAGEISPLQAAALPHIVFFWVSMLLLWRVPK